MLVPRATLCGGRGAAPALLCAAALISSAAALAQPAAVTITTERLSPVPLDKDIYGVLLEHIGGQMDTMWAELLQDNSFEGPREYSKQSENWAEGKIEPGRFWWHSGYELHPWRSFGAAAIQTTFAVNMMHGMHGKTIANRGDRPSGIAQDGIALRRGLRYRFSGYLSPTARGSAGRPARARVTVGLYAGPDLSQPYATATILVDRPGFEKYTTELTAPETTDNATFALSVEPQAFAAADLLSLMPADNVSGWRADVIAALKKMGLTSFRYPGGCFASFVDWETMVGPPEQRLPFTNPFWGGLEPNHVGTDEFLRLMELAGGDPLLEVNMMTGSPEKAAAWVEYCNAKASTHYGAKRARNGHPTPYGVKYWELDNEVARRFSAPQYGDACVRYAQAMKAVDPSIRLMAVSYFWSDEELAAMLDRAAASIDFLAVRTVDAGELAKYRKLAERYSTPAHRLRIASTEWRNKWRKDAWEPMRIEGSQRKAEMAWGYAIECARTLQQFQRDAADLRMAMFPTVTNLYGEDLMRIGKSEISFTGSGKVFELMSEIRGYPVRTLMEAAKTEKLDANAVFDDVHDRLVCTLVYGGRSPAEVEVDARQWPRTAPLASVTALEAGDRKTSTVRGEKGRFRVTLSAESVSKLEFSFE